MTSALKEKWMGTIRTYSKPRYCVVCGQPIPSTKRSYCSEVCHDNALKIVTKNDRKFARELGMRYDEYIEKGYRVSHIQI